MGSTGTRSGLDGLVNRNQAGCGMASYGEPLLRLVLTQNPDREPQPARSMIPSPAHVRPRSRHRNRVPPRRVHLRRAPAIDCQCVPVPGAEDALCDAIVQHGAPAGDCRLVAVPRAGSTRPCPRRRDRAIRRRLRQRRPASGDRAPGVLCTNTPDVLQQSVAELTMTMIGAAARHGRRSAVAMRGGRWSPRQGVELEGKTLALIGCGAIAQAVARIAVGRFRHARDRLRAHRPGRTPSQHFAAMTDRLRRRGRRRRLRQPAHSRQPGERAFHRCASASRCSPPRAWLINTARGAVVDERGAVRRARGRTAGGRGARRVRARAVRARRCRLMICARSPNVILRAAHRQQHGGSQPAHGARARCGTCSWRTTGDLARWI